VLAVHHVGTSRGLAPGGAEKYIGQALTALLDAGARVHVGYSGDSIYADILERIDPARLTVERTGWLNEHLSGDARLQWRTIRERRRWLRATGADTVFVVQQAGGGAFAASIVAARTLGLRVVASMRQWPAAMPAPSGKRWLGVIPSPEVWRRRLIWRRRIPAWCCDAIIYNSQRVADAFSRDYGFPLHRARIIPNGEIPDERPRAADIRRPLRLGSVGRVTEAKGADVLLDAFARVARRRSDIDLTYFGEGPLIPELRNRAKLIGLDDRVHFAGHQTERDAIYSNIDVYVHPSRREAMSNSVIEAMVRGIPCVVSDAGGLPETVEDGRSGFVVRGDDAEGYAEAIDRLLRDGATFSQFSHAAWERGRRHFDIRLLMRETVEVILGLAPEARG